MWLFSRGAGPNLHEPSPAAGQAFLSQHYVLLLSLALVRIRTRSTWLDQFLKLNRKIVNAFYSTDFRKHVWDQILLSLRLIRIWVCTPRNTKPLQVHPSVTEWNNCTADSMHGHNMESDHSFPQLNHTLFCRMFGSNYNSYHPLKKKTKVNTYQKRNCYFEMPIYVGFWFRPTAEYLNLISWVNSEGEIQVLRKHKPFSLAGERVDKILPKKEQT